jgi:hypothetical protein
MSKLTEVIKTLIDVAVAIDMKIELIDILDKNEDLIKKFKIKPKYRLNDTKNLYSIQLKEYCIIKICSFLDEYNSFFTISYIEKVYEHKINEVKQVLKPFVKEIKRNYNLKEYRNQILAHNLRDKSKSLLMGDISTVYKFPKYNEEFKSINKIINLMIEVIINQFKYDLPNDYWDDKVINSKKIVLDRSTKVFDIEKLEETVELFLKNLNNKTNR